MIPLINATTQKVGCFLISQEYCNMIFAVGLSALILSFFGATMNSLIIYLAVKILSKADRQETQHLCILSMAVADWLFTAIHLPIMFLRMSLRIQFSVPSCRFLYLNTHMTLVASSLSLLSLNIDKFISLRSPLRYHSIITYKCSKLCLLGIWSAAITWAVFFVFGPIIRIDDYCQPVYEGKHGEILYLTFFVLFFVIPIVTSFGISVYIFSVARMARKDDYGNLPHKHKGWCPCIQKQTIQDPPPESIPLDVTRGSQESPCLRSAITKFRTVVFVFSTTVWSFCTLVPYRAVYLTFPKDKEGWEEWLVMITYLVIITNPVGNPFITAITQPQYRNRLKRCFLRKKEDEYLTPSTSMHKMRTAS